MKTVKARIRAWLIDLVREAIRSELAIHSNPLTSPKVGKITSTAPRVPLHMKHDFPGRIATPGDPELKPYPGVLKETWDATEVERSFEQMQAEAIAAQTKFYEVAK